MASTLPPEIVEDILLHIQPDEPAHLVHATLVCKAWRHILSDKSFLHRYRRFHQSAPLLGYIHNCGNNPYPGLVPISTTTSPVSMPPHEYSWAFDCHHGRVLFLVNKGKTKQLLVWDPITGGQHYTSDLPYSYSAYAAAVLCVTDGCDHLDCHGGGQFQVALLGTNNPHDVGILTWATVYSSKTGAWSALTSIDTDFCILGQSSLLIGDVLYFIIGDGMMVNILKYDLGKHELSVIDMPGEYSVIYTPRVYNMLMTLMSLVNIDDGVLGIVALLDNCIYMWLRPHDTGGGWVKHKVMELGMLLPQKPLPPKVISFAEGTHGIFISMPTGIFLLDLKSRQVRKVGEKESQDPVLPHVSFYTPRFC